MKVVLDTSVLIASIGKHSPFRPIYNSLLNGEYVLATSTEILLEYAEKLEEKTSPSVSQNILELLSVLPNIQNQEIL